MLVHRPTQTSEPYSGPSRAGEGRSPAHTSRAGCGLVREGTGARGVCATAGWWMWWGRMEAACGLGMTLLTHGGSLLWALLVVWHAVGKGGSLLWALLCGVREARQHTVARRRALTVFSIVCEIPFFRCSFVFYRVAFARGRLHRLGKKKRIEKRIQGLKKTPCPDESMDACKEAKRPRWGSQRSRTLCAPDARCTCCGHSGSVVGSPHGMGPEKRANDPAV